MSFELYIQVNVCQNTLKSRCWLLCFFLKNKKWSGTSLPFSFSARFFKINIFLTLYSVSKLNFIVWLLLCLEILENMSIVLHSVNSLFLHERGRGGGVNLQPNFEKEGASQDLKLQREVAGKEGVAYNFHIKNKWKFEMFNDKKSL